MRALISIAALLFVLAVAWIAWNSASSPADLAAELATDPRPATPGDTPARPDGQPEGEPDAPIGETRSNVGEATPPRAEDPAAKPRESQAWIVSGRVVSTEGVALAGLALAIEGARAAAPVVSGADGRFEFDAAAGAFALLDSGRRTLLLAPGQAWASALETPFSRESSRDLLVVAAPAIELAGTVVDAAGGPVEGATVECEISRTQIRKFPWPLDRNAPRNLSTTTDRRGAFRLESVPATAPELTASRGERSRGSVDLTGSTALDLRIVLGGGTEPEEPRIVGVVLDQAGAPAAKARVRLYLATTETGDDGSFALEIPNYLPPGIPLVAAARGFQAAIEPSIGERIEKKDFSPLVLRLGGPTLEIRGRVLLADDTPGRGWNVVLEDPTSVSGGSLPPTTAEGLATGDKAGRLRATTDRDGGFVLPGLADRPYTVRAWQEKTLLVLRAERVPAGTQDLVLRVGPDAVVPRVTGVVVDPRGKPVSPASVTVELVTFSTPQSSMWESSDVVPTDAEGRFVLTNVPRALVRVAVHGDGLMERRFEVGALDLASELRLEVELRCHFRLVRERSEFPATRGEVLDESGKTLQLFEFQSGGWSSSETLYLGEDGGSPTVGVSESARTLVLHAHDEELARLPLALVPGEVNEVRY